jgi:ubiquinone biosynthesis monooxygenase Coq7
MFLDQVIVEVDKVFKNLFIAPISRRQHPGAQLEAADLSAAQTRQVIGLMRINHCGELCAQGLYQGQALTAREINHREVFADAAFEEVEHLAWTAARIEELGGKTSILGPLFYLGSLGLGVAAGILGDKWNLGFLKETEKQVEQHLTTHLSILPPQDQKSKEILTQMRADEIEHAQMAHDYGAAELPQAIKLMMKFSSKIMTKTTYYL